MTEFNISSQKSRWLFTPEDLDSIRYTNIQDKLNRPAWEIPALLQDEEITIQSFCRQILMIFGKIPSTLPESKMIRRRWRLPCTTIAYFRRFYLFNSMVDHDPRLIMLCCMFLAGKTEDNYIRIEDFARITTKFTEEDIFTAENALLEGLKFDLFVHHPNNSIEPFLNDWKQYILQHPNSITFQQLKCKLFALTNDMKKSDSLSELSKYLTAIIMEWSERAKLFLYFLQTTIAPLLYRPLTLAIYSLISTAPIMSVVDKSDEANGATKISLTFDSYLIDKLGSSNWTNMIEEMKTLGRYAEEISSYSQEPATNYMNMLKQTNNWHVKVEKSVDNQHSANGSTGAVAMELS